MIGTQVLVATTAIVMFIYLLSSSHLGGLGNSGQQLFNWHPFLQTIGFVLFTESILLYASYPESKAIHRIHALLTTVGLVSLITAVAMVHRWKEEINVAHWYSVHSWLGTLTILLLLTQWVQGILIWLFPDGCRNTYGGKFIEWHNLIGGTAYVCLLSSILLGLHNEQSVLPDRDVFSTNKQFANWAAILIAFTGCFSLHWLFAATITAQHYGVPIGGGKGGAGEVEEST